MNSVGLELKEFRALLYTLGLLGLFCGADKVVKLLGTHSVSTLFNFHEIRRKKFSGSQVWGFFSIFTKIGTDEVETTSYNSYFQNCHSQLK